MQSYGLVKIKKGYLCFTCWFVHFGYLKVVWTLSYLSFELVFLSFSYTISTP